MSLRKSSAESSGVEVGEDSSNTNISSSEGMSIFRLGFCFVIFISGMVGFTGSERRIAGAIAVGGGFGLLGCAGAAIEGAAIEGAAIGVAAIGGGVVGGGVVGDSTPEDSSQSSKSAPEASFSFHERMSARVMPSARLMAVSALMLSSGISATTSILPELR